MTVSLTKGTNLNVFSTKMHKVAASTPHHTDEMDKRAAHRLMIHKPSTAEKYYISDKLNEASEKGSMVLGKNLILSDTVATLEIDHLAGSTKDRMEDKLMFADIFQTYGPLTMDMTRNRMSESMSLIEFVSDPKMLKKVYERVVHLKRKDLAAKLAQTEDQPSEQDTKIDHRGKDTKTDCRGDIQWPVTNDQNKVEHV